MLHGIQHENGRRERPLANLGPFSADVSTHCFGCDIPTIQDDAFRATVRATPVVAGHERVQ